MLRLLGSPPDDVLRRWNWWISEYRRLVLNSAILPMKVGADLKSGRGDAAAKSKAVLGEILAVLHLSKMGFKDFNAVLPDHRSRPDFMADFARAPARIEVKSLAEPEDWITKVATARCEERSQTEPARYSFRAVLKHNNRGSVSDTAVNRLKCIVGQLPDIRKPFLDEELDGDIRVRFEKYDLNAEPEDFLEQKMYKRYRTKPRASGYLSVITRIGYENLKFNLGGFQALFLKVLRVIAEATPKFFSKSVERVPHNVMVVHWETPDPFVDPGAPELIQEQIEALFANFGLQLKVIIFWREPEVPLRVLKGN